MDLLTFKRAEKYLITGALLIAQLRRSKPSTVGSFKAPDMRSIAKTATTKQTQSTTDDVRYRPVWTIIILLSAFIVLLLRLVNNTIITVLLLFTKGIRYDDDDVITKNPR